MNPIQIHAGQVAYEWWDLVPAIVGGIVGALAGGIPSYILAKRASREENFQQKAQSQRQDRSKAFRLFIQLRDVLNDVLNTINQIDEMLAPHDRLLSDRFHLQRHIRPFANLNYRTSIWPNIDDVALLASEDTLEYMTRLLLVFERYNAILEAMRTFTKLKERHMELLLEAAEHDIQSDGRVTSQVDRALYAKIELYEAQLESVIAPTMAQLTELKVDAIGVAGDFRDAIRSAMPNSGPVPGFEKSEIDKFREVPGT